MSVDHARVKSHFLEIVAIDEPVARAARLNERCGEDADLRARVDALLVANDQAQALARTRTAADPNALTADLPGRDEQIGTVLGGKYKLVEEVGEGGMGRVYMAQQTEPVKRAVAVKVIKAGMDSKAVLARFEAERQALALMDHPNIAKVLDAGTTDGGRPFFVMELVKGMPITQYCDERKLTPRQRLELFVPVCNAVQHAHQKGVIHRDIKPSNVLVALYDDRPVPKVIDFGVAKAAGLSLTDRTLMTGFGAVVGTPEYMSPEQASLNNLDIDTRSDVYSLGVLLYELLTGTTPVDRTSLGKAALLEILRIVREVETPKPSAKLSSSDTLPSVAANRGTEPAKLSKLMKGELDWVVLKALEKDRTRRYDTANGLARDVQRYLADELVEARPPSAGYRLRKFVKRHKGRVVAAALVLFALLAGVIGTTWGLVEAKRQEKIALAEVKKQEDGRKRTREALDTLTADALEGWFTRERWLDPGQKDVLRRLIDQYSAFAEETGDTPDTRKAQIRALIRIGRMQQALGERQAAGQTLGRATQLAGTATAPITDDPDGWTLVSDTYTTLFKFYLDGRLYAEAEPVAREALAAQARLLATDPTQPKLRHVIASRRLNLAAALGEQDRLEAADIDLQAAIADLERLVREYPLEMKYEVSLALALNNRSTFFRRGMRLEDALALNTRCIEIRRRHVQAAPQMALPLEDLVKALDVRADIFRLANRPGESEPVIREAIRGLLELSEMYPSSLEYRIRLAGDFDALSKSLLYQGRHAAAAEEAQRAVKVARLAAGDFPDDMSVGRTVVSALLTLNRVEIHRQSYPEAESAAQAALDETERLTKLFGRRPNLVWDRADVLRQLSVARHHRADHSGEEAAQRELSALLAEGTRDYPEQPAWTSMATVAHFDLAATLIRRGATDAAEAELRAAAANLDRLPDSDREHFRGVYYHEMAKLTVGAGRWSDGVKWGTQAVDFFAGRFKQNPSFDESRAYLVQAHWHRATAREHLNRHADAAADWVVAADLADRPMDKAFYRAHQGAALIRGGDLATAKTEFAAAVRQAEDALKSEKPIGIMLYDAAAVYALSVRGSTDPSVVEKYASTAVGLLGRAAETGFLRDPTQLEALSTSEEYTTLHGRDDYKTLIADLKKKLPQKKDSPPPPKK